MGNGICCVSRGDKSSPDGTSSSKGQEKLYFVKQAEGKGSTHTAYEPTEASRAKTIPDIGDPNESLSHGSDSDDPTSNLNKKSKEKQKKSGKTQEKDKTRREFNFQLKLPTSNQTGGECLDDSTKQDEQDRILLRTRNHDSPKTNSVIENSQLEKSSKVELVEPVVGNTQEADLVKSENPESSMPKPEVQEDDQAMVDVDPPQCNPEDALEEMIEPIPAQSDCTEVLEPKEEELKAVASNVEDKQPANENQEEIIPQDTVEEVKNEPKLNENAEEKEIAVTILAEAEDKPVQKEEESATQKEAESDKTEAPSQTNNQNNEVQTTTESTTKTEETETQKEAVSISNEVQEKSEPETKVDEPKVDSPQKTEPNQDKEEGKSPTEGPRSSRNSRKTKTMQPKVKYTVQYIPKATETKTEEKPTTPTTENQETLSPTRKSGKLVSALKSPQNSITKTNKEVSFAMAEKDSENATDSNSMLNNKNLEVYHQLDDLTAGLKFDKKWVQELKDTVPEPSDTPKKISQLKFSNEENKMEDGQRLSEKFDVGTPDSRNADFRTSVDSETIISDNSQTPRSSYISATSSRSNLNEDEERPSKKKRHFRKYATMKK